MLRFSFWKAAHPTSRNLSFEGTLFRLKYSVFTILARSLLYKKQNRKKTTPKVMEKKKY